MFQELGPLCSNCIRIFQDPRSWSSNGQVLWENNRYVNLLRPRSCNICAILWTCLERTHRGDVEGKRSRDCSEIRYVWSDVRARMDAAGERLTIEGQYAGEEFTHTLATMYVVPALSKKLFL